MIENCEEACDQDWKNRKQMSMKREHGRFGFKKSSKTIKFKGIKNTKAKQYNGIADLEIPRDVIDRVWKELDLT